MSIFLAVKEEITRKKCKRCKLPKSGILEPVIEDRSGSIVSYHCRFMSKKEAGICDCNTGKKEKEIINKGEG